MLSELQEQLIKEAEENYGEILPIGQKAQHNQKSFTEHVDSNNISWIYFWFDDKTHSSRIIKKRTTCPQCGGELKYNISNEHGHCVCEKRGI